MCEDGWFNVELLQECKLNYKIIHYSMKERWRKRKQSWYFWRNSTDFVAIIGDENSHEVFPSSAGDLHFAVLTCREKGCWSAGTCKINLGIARYVAVRVDHLGRATSYCTYWVLSEMQSHWPLGLCCAAKHWAAGNGTQIFHFAFSLFNLWNVHVFRE